MLPTHTIKIEAGEWMSKQLLIHSTSVGSISLTVCTPLEGVAMRFGMLLPNPQLSAAALDSFRGRPMGDGQAVEQSMQTGLPSNKVVRIGRSTIPFPRNPLCLVLHHG